MLAAVWRMDWTGAEMEPGRPASDFCWNPGGNRWRSQLQWQPQRWSPLDLPIGAARACGRIRGGQERENQGWVRILALSCYRVGGSVLRRNLEGGAWGRDMKRSGCAILCVHVMFELLVNALRWVWQSHERFFLSSKLRNCPNVC